MIEFVLRLNAFFSNFILGFAFLLLLQILLSYGRLLLLVRRVERIQLPGHWLLKVPVFTVADVSIV